MSDVQQQECNLFFVRMDRLELDRAVIVSLHAPAGVPASGVQSLLEKSVSEWVASTKEGRDLWDESVGDLNIGDLLSWGAFSGSSLGPFMSRHGLSFNQIIDVGCDQISYDRVLSVDPSEFTEPEEKYNPSDDCFDYTIPFVRIDDLMVDQAVAVTLRAPSGLTDEAVVDLLEKGVSEWVATTQEGQELWGDRVGDLNIGDLDGGDALAMPSLSRILAGYGVAFLSSCRIDGETIDYDRVLSMPPPAQKKVTLG